MKKGLSFFLAFLWLSVASVYAKEPHQGYRGFIDLDFTGGKALWFSDADGRWTQDGLLFMGLATSHGYQIDRHSYVGGGFMLSFSYPCTMLPVFADYRYDVSFGKFTPYADVRLGYSLSDGGGVYFSPTVGYRVNWGRKANFNIGLGMTICGQTRDKYESEYYEDSSGDSYYMVYYTGKEHHYYPRFSLRFGFDF